MQKHTQINIWYFILAFLAVVWIRDIWVASRHIEEISYSEFQQSLEDGRIENVEILADTIRGAYRNAHKLCLAHRSCTFSAVNDVPPFE